MFEMKAKKAPDVMIRQVRDESVILDLNTERYLGLDDVGTHMWKALLASDSVEQAYEQLRDLYRVEPDVLRKDLESFVTALVQHGILELHAK
jgi:Coenzyme PQQ synthesis protein D (PqqD)